MRHYGKGDGVLPESSHYRRPKTKGWNKKSKKAMTKAEKDKTGFTDLIRKPE